MHDMKNVDRKFSVDKLKKFEDDYKTFIKEFRENIPEERNKVRLADYYTSGKRHYMNITNRIDGKSFQNAHLYLCFSNKFKIGTTFLVRHFDLRKAIHALILEVCEKSPFLDEKKLAFRKDKEYDMVFLNNTCIALITEINNQLDLKSYSSMLKYYPVIWYDEFLAPRGYYSRHEMDGIKNIYQSINRASHPIPIIKNPIIVYTGNPMNFDSEILHFLNVFNDIEEADLGKIIEGHKYYFLLERNEKALETIETDAFGDPEEDPMMTGQFFMNKYNIVSRETRDYILESPNSFIVKIDDDIKFKVFYREANGKHVIYLSMLPYFNIDTPTFVKRVEDMNQDSFLIDDRYLRTDFQKNYVKTRISFDNIFSKNKLLENSFFKNVNIKKMVLKDKRIKEKRYESLNPNEKHKYLLDKKDEYEQLRKVSSMSSWIFGYNFHISQEMLEAEHINNVQ